MYVHRGGFNKRGGNNQNRGGPHTFRSGLPQGNAQGNQSRYGNNNYSQQQGREFDRSGGGGGTSGNGGSGNGGNGGGRTGGGYNGNVFFQIALLTLSPLC